MINRINNNFYISATPDMNSVYDLNASTVIQFDFDDSRLNLRNTGAMIWRANKEELESHATYEKGISLAAQEVFNGRKTLVLCQSHKLRQISFDVLERFGFSAEDFSRLVGTNGR